MAAASDTRPHWVLRAGLWLVTLAAALAASAGAISVLVLARGPGLKQLPWEDLLTTFVGVWLLACIPISLMRWLAVPAARYGKTLTGPLLTMATGGIAFVMPVLSERYIDPIWAFGVVMLLFVAQAVLVIAGHRDADELMRRFTMESTVISSNVLLAGFSIYAVAEYLGLIGALSPWGLVGIACIVQFTVAMVVYYRLGLNPEAQTEAPAS